MNRLAKLLAVLFAFPFPLPFVEASELQGKPRSELPNLLLVTFDTTRVDRLGCYGFKRIRTPSVDRLAREGVLFENVYGQAPQTMPNHTSLFTGLYTITHDVLSNGQRLSDEAVTLAEMLSAAGYRTGAIVAAAPLMKEYNLNQGFDHYNDEFRDNALFGGFKSFLRFFSANKINIPTSRPANRVAELSMAWLRQAAKGKKPFFLWVHFFDPHDPYQFRPDFDQPEVVEEDSKLNEYGYKEASYINEIEFADHYLGKILALVDRLGLTERTLTVFTTDHGESLGEHDYRGHRQEVYEEVIRVPLILRWPGHLPEGERRTSPGMTIDIAPTVLKLLDVPYLPDSFQGTDLFSVAADEPRRIYSVAVKLFTKSPIRKAIIYGEYKYIEFDDPARNALFHLKTDADEQVNLLNTDHPGERQVAWSDEIQKWFEVFEKMEFSDFRLSPEQLRMLRSLGYVN
jgi:arylsulfatase A-like enzyme